MEKINSFTTNTPLASNIHSVGVDNPSYDKNAKELLGDVQILARILKHTMTEFKHRSIEEIKACISGVDIAASRVDPGMTNLAVQKLAQEDSVRGEGTIYYDIRFNAIIKSEKLKFIINVEAQSNEKPGYPLENRIVFYLSRMVSAQKNTEFFNSDYGNIKKVVSIWICLSNHDSIDEFSLKTSHVFGKDSFIDELDLMQAFIIRIRQRNDVEESRNVLISMLEDLLRKESAVVKKKRLAEKHHLIMTQEFERKVDFMCDLSEALVEEGRKEILFRYVQEGIVSLARAAKDAGMSEEEFKAAMREAGYYV